MLSSRRLASWIAAVEFVGWIEDAAVVAFAPSTHLGYAVFGFDAVGAGAAVDFVFAEMPKQVVGIRVAVEDVVAVAALEIVYAEQFCGFTQVQAGPPE